MVFAGEWSVPELIAQVVQSVDVPTVIAVPAKVQAKPVRVSVPTLKVPPERVMVEPEPVILTVWPEASRVPEDTVILAVPVPVRETVPAAVRVPPLTLSFAPLPVRVKV